jgi:ubiquitin thioesterase OTU1
MYKKRLNRWGLVKYNKEHEIKAILSKRMERSAVGKNTAFELRGRLVDMADVDQYARRKPITMRDIMAWRSAGAKTPSGLRCFTPEPLIQCPHPPEVFSTPERLLRDVRIYSIGSFEARTWVSQGLQRFCTSVKDVDSTSDAIEEIRDSLTTACILIDQNSILEAGAQLDAACSKIRKIVLAENPQTITRLIEIMVLVKAFGRPELVGMMLRQLVAMSAIILPTPHHPMHSIFTALCRLELQQFDEMALRAWDCMIGVFHHFLGPSHLSTRVSKLDRLDTAISSLDKERSDEYLKTILEAGRGACGSDLLESVEGLVSLGGYLRSRKRYTDLLEVGGELIQRITSWDAADPEGTSLLRWGIEFTTTAHFAQCDFEQAMTPFEILVGPTSEETDPKMWEYQTPARPISRPAATTPSAPISLKRKNDSDALNDPLEVLLPDRGGAIVQRVMPDDNSCLFRAIASAVLPGMDVMNELRSVIASTVQANPVEYSKVILDNQEPDDYCRWIQTEDAWGGQIELVILSKQFELEICSIDIKSGRVDKYNEGKPTRCILIYSGIHYDTVAFSRFNSPPEEDEKVFQSSEDEILDAAVSLCQKLKERGYYTNTAAFKIKCMDCGTISTGEKGAAEHASKTGHYDVKEVRT